MIRILIADDEEIVRSMFKRHLSDYDLTFATNWAELLSVLNRQKFDLVITDVIMPDQEEIGQKGLLNVMTEFGVPVIFVSGYSQYNDVKLPANMLFLSKPFAPVELKASINQLLNPV